MAGHRAGHPADARRRVIDSFSPRTRANWMAGSSPAMVSWGFGCSIPQGAGGEAGAFGETLEFRPDDCGVHFGNGSRRRGKAAIGARNHILPPNQFRETLDALR